MKAIRNSKGARFPTFSACVLWWVRVRQYVWLIIHQKVQGYVYFATYPRWRWINIKLAILTPRLSAAASYLWYHFATLSNFTV